MKSRFLSIAVLICALIWAISGEAEQPSAIQADDHGQFTITQATKAGAITLEPGTYVIQHHTSQGRDVLRFMLARTERELSVTWSWTGWVNKTELSKVADVPVDLQPSAKVSATTVTVTNENRTPRITQVTIKGKSQVYDLPQK